MIDFVRNLVLLPKPSPKPKDFQSLWILAIHLIFVIFGEKDRCSRNLWVSQLENRHSHFWEWRKEFQIKDL
jgi:hypothetical protein